VLRAAIYSRYSSGLQKATSIDDQVARCRGAAARFNCLVLDDHLYTDQEISGTVEQRPAYRRLMKSAQTGQFDAVLVESQDRLWRDQGEMHSALKRLRFWGIKVFSVASGAAMTDSTGKLMASVTGWKDEIFAGALRDKTVRGMAGQIRRGLSAGGRAYGYRSEPIYDAVRRDPYGNPAITGSRRVVEATEAAIVRRVFKMYVAGLSAKLIAHRLNEEHVPPPRWRENARTKRGWTWTTIAGSPRRSFGILNNPMYVGRLVWSRSQKVRDPDTGKRVMRARPQDDWVSVDAPELRIVPDALWAQVQTRQASKRRPEEEQAKGRPIRHMLSGLLRCSVCSCHYVIKSRRYYGCATNRNQGSAVCGNNRLARRDILEATVMRLVTTNVFSPKAIAYLTRRVNDILAQPRAPRKDTLRRELDQAQQRLENIKTAIREGLLTDTTRAMLEETELAVSQGKATLAAVDSGLPTPPVLPQLIERYLGHLRRLVDKDPARARSILAKLIGEVALEPNGKGLVAVLRGNIAGILDLEGRYCAVGAGRGILFERRAQVRLA